MTSKIIDAQTKKNKKVGELRGEIGVIRKFLNAFFGKILIIAKRQTVFLGEAFEISHLRIGLKSNPNPLCM